MKIAWVSTYDAANLADYNGRGYYAPQSLKDESTSIEYISPLKRSNIYRGLFKAKSIFYDRFLHKKYTYSRDVILLKQYANQISQKLSKLNNFNIVFSGVCNGSQPISYLDCKEPIVIWTDATFAAGTLDFYPGFGRHELCQETIRDGIANERLALNRSSLIIYSSTWAAQGAIDYYKLDPSKVKVVPFGANFECNRSLEDIKLIVNSRPLNPCKLLFMGMDWHRKGGDIAFQVAKELNKSGLKTELTIVGCRPDLGSPIPDFVKVAGKVNNATKQGLSKIYQFLAESHFLMMPSRAESFGHVFCEAASFGVPNITTNVGGIPTVVKDNLNGKTFDQNASIEEYCRYIFNLFSNYHQYKELALSSFNEYTSRLNWAVAGKTVKALVRELVL